MKPIWNILSIVAVANLVVVSLVVAGLFFTDKLDQDKLSEIREIVMSAPESEQAQDDDESATDEIPPSTLGVPIGSDGLEALRLEQSDIDRQKRERLRRQVEDLKRSLTVERQRLDKGWSDLRTERDAFADERERIKDVEGGKQFRTSVKVLEGLRPEQGRDVVLALIQGQNSPLLPQDPPATAGSNDPESGMRRAVAYINAMAERQRTKLMSAIADQDPALAAELLERLRTRGLGAGAEG